MRAHLFLILAFGAGVATYVFYLRYKTFGQRRATALRQIYDLENLANTIPFHDFCQTMEAPARAYSVQAEQLRLDDRFKAELGVVDSWAYGEGAEEAEGFLEVT